MKPELQKRVQRYGWDKASDIYDQYWQQQLKPAQDRLLEMVDLQQGEHVLDVACGTGLVTFPATNAVGSRGKVLGLDISDNMVASANKTAESAGIINVSFERMEAERLDLPDHTFDVVMCALGLMYIPEPQRTLKEMCRVLVPGGRIVVAVWGARANCGWSDVFPIVDRRVQTDVCPLFFRLGSSAVMVNELSEAGFKYVQTDKVEHKLHYSTADDACEAIFNAGPVAMAYHRFDENTKREVCEEYMDSIAPYRNHNGYEIPAEFLVAMGYK